MEKGIALTLKGWFDFCTLSIPLWVHQRQHWAGCLGRVGHRSAEYWKSDHVFSGIREGTRGGEESKSGC